VRHVVLEFADNEAAEEFVRKLAELQQTPDKEELTCLGIAMAAASYTKVTRVFAYPTMTCVCNEGESHHGDIGRSKKYGWLVHRKCGKPTTYWLSGAQLKSRKVEGWQNVAHSATNLLGQILQEEK
jgi:hypothetical protein